MSLGVPVDRLKACVSEAAEFVRELERQPNPHAMHGLISTSGRGADRFVAGRLLERSREEFSRDPRKSMALARAAIWVAERAGSAELQFEGWRDCASLCVRLGQYADAWDALDRAASFVDQTAEPLHARGVLLYAMAYVGSQPDMWRLDEALAWTEEAAAIFARTDRARLRATAEMRAFIHNVRGEHAAAVKICRDLWKDHQDLGLALNFAAYLVDYGDPERAHELLAWACERLPEDAVVMLAKHAGIEGTALVVQQKWEDAAEAFQRSVEAFKSLGMDEAAIRVELSRIRAEVSGAPESAVTLDRAIADLRRLAIASAELDQREPSRRRRFTAEAFQYLRELGDARALTVDSLRHVEMYLGAITNGPARPFVRPLPTRIM